MAATSALFAYAVVGAGGAVGSMLRFGLGALVQTRYGGTFPAGTLAVNIVGCLLIGFAMALLTGPLAGRPELRLAIVAGVLGGFTTFSAFSWEALMLMQQGQWKWAAVYVLASVLAGLVATFAGMRLAQWLYGS